MHPVGDQGSSSVPAFLTKLWTLVEDPSTNEFICWDASGKSFHVCDQGRFSKEVLPLYFKHSNIASFIRQLNMYGFRKVVGIESGGLKVERDDMEFAHAYFQRDKENLLEFIKRKVPNMKADEMKVKHDDVHRVLTDVRQLKGKQDNMSGKLDQLKRENELLWLEVASLRQKHMKQQQIVNKLIQFLMSLVGNRGVDRKRKMALMLNDASQIAAKKSRPRGQELHWEGKNYSVTPPDETADQPSLSIHELTDHTEDPSLVSGHEEFSAAQNDTSLPETILAEEPKDILQVLTEQSEILSKPSTTNTVPVPILSQDGGQFTLSAMEGLQTPTIDITDLINKPGPEASTADTASTIDAILASAAAPDTQDSNTTQNSVVPSKGADPKTLQRTNSHPVEIEMSEHLDGLQTELESLKGLLSSGQYTFEPTTIMNLFDLGSSILVDQPSTSKDMSELISGHEVVQYNPPEDISTLFDLGDLSSSTPLDEDSAEAALREMVEQGSISTLNTPVPQDTDDALPFITLPTTTTTGSTEELD